jgi:2-keto-4-pentenoate hydratase
LTVSNRSGVSIDDEVVAACLAARESGTRSLDLTPYGIDREVALDVQLMVLDELIRRGDEIAGWKVGFTSGSVRDKMGPGYRPFGFMLKSHAFNSGDHVPIIPRHGVASPGDLVIEAELCLVLRHDLNGPVSREVAREAVGSVVSSFELVQRRAVSSADDATGAADGFANWGLVLGSEVLAIPEELAGTKTELRRNGELVSVSSSDFAIDDAFSALASLSGKLYEHGRGLEAGQSIITGMILKADIDGPAEWLAAFEGVGEVSVLV